VKKRSGNLMQARFTTNCFLVAAVSTESCGATFVEIGNVHIVGLKRGFLGRPLPGFFSFQLLQQAWTANRTAEAVDVSALAMLILGAKFVAEDGGTRMADIAASGHIADQRVERRER